VYEQLRSRLASILRRPRIMKPQTQRQLVRYLDEHRSSLASFLLCAANVLEEYELDIVFGPLFTPTLDERAEVADLLFHWRPTPRQAEMLSGELLKDVSHVPVSLADGSLAELTLHQVMVERYVGLLRLESGPEASTAAAMRDALPAELWPIAMALACERGMTPRHQAWFAEFINHLASRHPISRGLLETTADFVARQSSLRVQDVLAAAEAVQRATEGTAAYTASGHAYWSPDVAQHHHYRGQGNVDHRRLAQHQAELGRVTMMIEGLKTFPSPQEELS
jgi:hypothetical protein